jgi:hypothetical protein
MLGSVRLKLLRVIPVLLSLLACGAEDEKPPACYEAPDPSACAPLYAPEFEQIFTRRFAETCGTEGGSCHGANSKKGGLDFSNIDVAYAGLLGQNGEKSRVVPGNVLCSELMVRLDVVGHAWSMPPKQPLDERERCTIRRWIVNGAAR